VRTAANAGAKPKSNVVTTAAAAVNRSTGRSMVTVLWRGRYGDAAAMRRTLAQAAAKPNPAASAASSALSVRSCRMMRAHDAPRAARMAISRWRVADGPDTRAPIGWIAILGDPTAAEVVDLGLGSAQSHAGLEAPEYADGGHARNARCAGGDGEKNGDIGAVEIEAGREDRDDGVGILVEDDLPADDAGVGSETALPEGVAEDGDAGSAGLILFGEEVAAEGRVDAGEGEESRVDAAGGDALGVASEGEVGGTGGESGQRLERVGAGAPPFAECVVFDEGAVDVEVWTLGADGDEPAGVAIGQGA
jgi:hypothetical protein